MRLTSMRRSVRLRHAGLLKSPRQRFGRGLGGLVASLYLLYRDLWDKDCHQPELERVPLLLRGVLAVTQQLPKPGRWE
jgi:hypothetical protein